MKTVDFEQLSLHMGNFKSLLYKILSRHEYRYGAPAAVIHRECELAEDEHIDANFLEQVLWMMARQDGKVWINHRSKTNLTFEVFQKMAFKKEYPYKGGSPWKKDSKPEKGKKSSRAYWDVYDEQETSNTDDEY